MRATRQVARLSERAATLVGFRHSGGNMLEGLAVEAIDEPLLTNSGVSIVLVSMVTHYLISIEVFEVSTSEPGVP